MKNDPSQYPSTKNAKMWGGPAEGQSNASYEICRARRLKADFREITGLSGKKCDGTSEQHIRAIAAMFIRYEIPEIDKYRFLGWAFFRMKQSQRVSYIQKKVFDEEVDILRRKEAA